MKKRLTTDALPQGYAEVRLATRWAQDSEFWGAFMRDVIRLPAWMLPVVQIVIPRRAWRRAVDPLRQIRAASIREAARMGLRAGRRPARSVPDGASRNARR